MPISLNTQLSSLSATDRGLFAPSGTDLRTDRQSEFSSVLGRVQARPDESPEDMARRAAEQFVSMALVQPLLKQMRDANNAAPPFAPSQGEKQFQSLMDAEVAQRMVRAAHFPLVDRLARDMLTKARGVDETRELFHFPPFDSTRQSRASTMTPQRRPNHRPPTLPSPAAAAAASRSHAAAVPAAAWRPAGGVAPAQPVALEQLESVLRDLLGAHEQMLTLTTEHRRAISEADIGALQKCMASQGEVARTISALERQRQTIVAGLTGQRPGTITPLPSAPGTPRVTMSTLAKAVPEPVRTRLLSITDALRDLLNRLHREHMALRQAAETLSSHMEGVMRQVCRTLSHAGTYARSGAIDSSVQVAAALDVRT